MRYIALLVILSFSNLFALNPKPSVLHSIPRNEHFLQNYPNPFNPITSIEYTIPISAHVSLIIYNLAVQEMDQLVNQNQGPESYSVTCDARNVSRGVYFYKIQADGFMRVKKCVLIK